MLRLSDDPSTPMTLGARVAAARLALGLSQTAFAEGAGISASALCRVERDKARPHLKALTRIATLACVSLERLLGAEPAEAEAWRPDRDPLDAAWVIPRRRRDAKLGPHLAIGDRVRRVRRDRRLTLEGLAAAAGIGRQTLIRIERGAVLPETATARRIAEVGGVTLDWLLSGGLNQWRDLQPPAPAVPIPPPTSKAMIIRTARGGRAALPPPERVFVPVVVRRGERTLADLLRPFLGWLGSRRSQATVEQYWRDLRQFVTFCRSAGIEKSTELVDHRVIEAYLAWLGSKLMDRGLKVTSVNQHLCAIRSFCFWLEREGHAMKNAAANAIGPKVPRWVPGDGEYLGIAEQETLLEDLSRLTDLIGRRDYALVAFGLMVGPRVAEMAGQLLADVHLDPHEGRVLIHGKGNKTREVPVVPRLVAILRPYVDEVRPALLGSTPSPFFFVRGHLRRPGLPMTTRGIWWLLDHRVSPILGRHIHPHLLRHSFATRLRAQGADLQYVQLLLGHANVSTTMVYSHFAGIKQREELARYLEPAAPQAGHGSGPSEPLTPHAPHS